MLVLKENEGIGVKEITEEGVWRRFVESEFRFKVRILIKKLRKLIPTEYFASYD